MPRIHENTATLKTLFVIKSVKPLSSMWNSQQGFEMSESNALTIVLYDQIMVEHLLNYDCWPPYIVQAYRNPVRQGLLTFKDGDGQTVNQDEILTCPTYDGIPVALELNPCYARADVLRDLYTRLTAIANDYIEVNDYIEIDFNEDFCWLGAHHNGLLPIEQRKLNRG